MAAGAIIISAAVVVAVAVEAADAPSTSADAPSTFTSAIPVIIADVIVSDALVVGEKKVSLFELEGTEMLQNASNCVVLTSAIQKLIPGA